MPAQRYGNPTLRFGKPSISRLHCPKCNEETLHHYRRCNHCGHTQAVFRSWEENYWSKQRALTVKKVKTRSPVPQQMSRREALNRLKKRLGLMHEVAA